MYGFKILCEISKVPFEISHTILNPYTAKYAFYCLLFLRVLTTSLNCDVIRVSETGPWLSGAPGIGIFPGDYGGRYTSIITLRPKQNGRHFTDDTFKRIFLKENVWILLKISLKFIREVWINHIPALVQIMAWRRPGDKPLSEPMMVNLLTHVWVTRPECVIRRGVVYSS